MKLTIAEADFLATLVDAYRIGDAPSWMPECKRQQLSARLRIAAGRPVSRPCPHIQIDDDGRCYACGSERMERAALAEDIEH